MRVEDVHWGYKLDKENMESGELPLSGHLQKLISYQRKADKMKFMKTQGESVSPTPEPLKAKGTLDSWVLAVDVGKIVEELREKQIGCCAKKLQMWTQPRRYERASKFQKHNKNKG